MSRIDRQKHDLGKILNTISSIDSSFTAASFKDFHRLGKFRQNASKPRPILVKFLRMFDATLVLSNRASIKSSQISIKPDLTKDEREINNILLKERRALINDGIEQKNIMMRGNTLYLNKKPYGFVRNSNFCKSSYTAGDPTVQMDAASN